MINKELLPATIQDLEECRDRILQRHEGDTTLCLRFDSVFKQLINTLKANTGDVIEQENSFIPKPLTNVFGKKINKSENVKLQLKPIEVDEVEAFREKIQLIYNGFVGRETTDLLDALTEIEIRGVAKLAGHKNFDKSAVDGVFIEEIKTLITKQAELKVKQEKKQAELNPIEPSDEIQVSK